MAEGLLAYCVLYILNKVSSLAISCVLKSLCLGKNASWNGTEEKSMSEFSDSLVIPNTNFGTIDV